jgi:hypothetical protein
VLVPAVMWQYALTCCVPAWIHSAQHLQLSPPQQVWVHTLVRRAYCNDTTLFTRTPRLTRCSGQRSALSLHGERTCQLGAILWQALTRPRSQEEGARLSQGGTSKSRALASLEQHSLALSRDVCHSNLTRIRCTEYESLPTRVAAHTGRSRPLAQ